MSRVHPAFNAFALILGLVLACAAMAADPAYTPFVRGKGGAPGGAAGTSAKDTPVVGGLGLLFLLPLCGAAALGRRRSALRTSPE